MLVDENPGPHVGDSLGRALASDTTACYQTIVDCTCCTQGEPIDNVIMICTTSTNQEVLVCSNCVYKGVANTCDVEVPTTVCIETGCEDLVVTMNTVEYKVSHLSPTLIMERSP